MFPIWHLVGSYVGYFFRRLYIYIYLYSHQQWYIMLYGSCYWAIWAKKSPCVVHFAFPLVKINVQVAWYFLVATRVFLPHVMFKRVVWRTVYPFNMQIDRSEIRSCYNHLFYSTCNIILTSIFFLSTEHVAIMVVKQFPPRLSRNTEVMREFL